MPKKRRRVRLFFSAEAVGQLSPEAFGEFFHVVKAERDVTAVVGDVGGAEEVVPDAEGEAVIHAVTMLGWEVEGVVPDVHLGMIEEILERAEGHAEVGVVEVPNDGGEEVDDDEVGNAESDECERNVLKDVVDDVFHPVIAEVSGEAHLLDRVVDFVKFPKPGDAMEEAVDIPLNEIAKDEED